MKKKIIPFISAALMALTLTSCGAPGTLQEIKAVPHKGKQISDEEAKVVLTDTTNKVSATDFALPDKMTARLVISMEQNIENKGGESQHAKENMLEQVMALNLAEHQFYTVSKGFGSGSEAWFYVADNNLIVASADKSLSQDVADKEYTSEPISEATLKFFDATGEAVQSVRDFLLTTVLDAAYVKMGDIESKEFRTALLEEYKEIKIFDDAHSYKSKGEGSLSYRGVFSFNATKEGNELKIVNEIAYNIDSYLPTQFVFVTQVSYNNQEKGYGETKMCVSYDLEKDANIVLPNLSEFTLVTRA